MKKNTKPQIKGHKYLKPAGKVALYGSLATAIAAAGLKAAGDYNLEQFNKDIKIDETITQCENILGPKDKELEVSKLDNKGMLSYTFDKNELLTDFKEARTMYLKYKNKPCISKADKEDKEKALDTIIESNDKLIELFNEVTKIKLASQLHVSPDQIDIYFNKPNENAETITTLKINGEEVEIGTELKELINTYKDGLLITYDVDLKNMPLSIKESKVERILNNIKEFRTVLNDINKPDTTYTIYRREPATDEDYHVYDNSEFDEELIKAYNIKPLPEVKFLDIKVKKKDTEQKRIPENAGNSSISQEEQEER